MSATTVGPLSESGRWAALGLGLSDPAPGDPEAVRALATSFRRKADTLRGAITALRAVVPELDSWKGQAADAFRTSNASVGRGLDEFVVQFDHCDEALTSFAGALDSYRARARALLLRLEEAKRTWSAADDGAVPFADDAAVVLRQVIAGGEIAKLIAEREWLELEYRASADKAIGRLDHPGQGATIGAFFGAAEDAFTSLRHAPDIIADAVVQELRDNAGALAGLGNYFGDVSTVLGTAALVVPVLEVPAAAMGGLALVAHVGARLAGAKSVSGGEIAWDVLGALPGARLAKDAVQASRAARAAKGAAETAGDGGATIGRKLSPNPDDPNDPLWADSGTDVWEFGKGLQRMGGWGNALQVGQDVKEAVAAAKQDPDSVFNRLPRNALPDSAGERVVSSFGPPGITLSTIRNYVQEGQAEEQVAQESGR